MKDAAIEIEIRVNNGLNRTYVATSFTKEFFENAMSAELIYYERMRACAEQALKELLKG